MSTDPHLVACTGHGDGSASVSIYFGEYRMWCESAEFTADQVTAGEHLAWQHAESARPRCPFCWARAEQLRPGGPFQCLGVDRGGCGRTYHAGHCVDPEGRIDCICGLADELAARADKLAAVNVTAVEWPPPLDLEPISPHYPFPRRS